MSLSPESLGRRAGQVLLTVTAVAGVLCGLATVGALVFGVHPVIVRSGSMTPTIPTGSIAFSHDVSASSLDVGDVVTVPSGESSVTHRIVDITRRADGKAVLTLKGDANNAADGQVYTIVSARRELFSVPRAGFVVAWLSKAPGSYVLALYVVAMLLLIGRRQDRNEVQGGEASEPAEPTPSLEAPAVKTVPSAAATPKTSRGPFAVVTAGAILAVGIAVVSGWGQSTWALWSDAGSNTGTTITTGTFGLTLTCSTSGNTLTLNWTYSPDPTTKFSVRSTGAPSAIPGTPVDVAKNLRTWTSSGFNNRSGEVWVVAVNGAVETESEHATYSFGSGAGGGNKSCTSP